MASWLYWVVVAAYLAAALVAARRVPAGARWLVPVATAVLGTVLLLPVRCRSLIMPMCPPGSAPGRCDASSDGCTTLVGLAVPYTDALGVAATRITSGVLVAATVAVVAVLATVRRQRPPRRPRGGRARPRSATTM